MIEWINILFMGRNRKKEKASPSIKNDLVVKHNVDGKRVEKNDEIPIENEGKGIIQDIDSVKEIVDKSFVEHSENQKKIESDVQKENEPVLKVESEKIEYPDSFSNNLTIHPSKEDMSIWFIVSASSIGESHIKQKTFCQDNHLCESIDKDWGIAICCDGAGSAKNSHIASKYISNEIGTRYFKDLVFKNDWHKKKYLPSATEWKELAREAFVNIYEDLEKFSESSKIEFSTLASTMIVVIFSPIGLLVSHIGDGRVGYCNEKGEWKPAIVPHKGEEANQTIFVTSKMWIEDSCFSISGMYVPESVVITEKPIAFSLMTDGCEKHSFECSVLDKTSNKWSDPNLPYSKFFNPLVENLRIMHKNNVTSIDANQNWCEFIKAGTNGLASEPDDKTMILGVLI